LLRGCAPAAALGSLVEAAGDVLAVLDRVVVVVLEFGVDGLDVQPQTADAGQHPAVGFVSDRHGCVPAVGLKVGELVAQQPRLCPLRRR